MEQNQTTSTATTDQNHTTSTATMDRNQTPSNETIDQNQTASTATMGQNQTSSTAVGFPVVAWSAVVSLVMRVLTFILLLVSLIVLATDSFDTVDIYGFPVTVKSNDFYAYRYVLSANVIGMTYTLIVGVLTFFHESSGTGSPNGRTGLAYFEFSSDKVITFLLATGAAAGLGLSVEFNRVLGLSNDMKNFLNQANAAASLLLLGSVSSSISSVLSSLKLPKRS